MAVYHDDTDDCCSIGAWPPAIGINHMVPLNWHHLTVCFTNLSYCYCVATTLSTKYFLPASYS